MMVAPQYALVMRLAGALAAQPAGAPCTADEQCYATPQWRCVAAAAGVQGAVITNSASAI